jgi:hypothetical protein
MQQRILKFRFLVDNGIPVDASAANAYNQTPLWMAAAREDKEAAEIL